MNFKVFDKVEPDEKAAVIDALVAYNDSKAPKENYDAIERFLKDEAGKVVGGIIGNTHWGWLFIKQFWVDESLRGKGVGTKLIRLIESGAMDRGCEWAWLDTFDFQALSFYEKLGYEVLSTLDDFPLGHKRIFLKKKLARTEDIA